MTRSTQEQLTLILHRRLEQRFNNGDTVRVTLNLCGTHSNCCVSTISRSATFHCYSPNDDDASVAYGCWLRHDEEHRSSANSDSMEEVIDAARDWLAGNSIESLHDSYPFADIRSRALNALLVDLLRFCPSLQSASPTVGPVGDPRLRFERGSRTCLIYLSLASGEVFTAFCADETKLMSLCQSDREPLAEALQAWLLKDMMPSALSAMFPSIQNTNLAVFYEKDRLVEGEFMESWLEVERYIAKFPEWTSEIALLMSILRDRGYHRHLRAGMSLSSLILSRSRRCGLKSGQYFVQFWFRENSMIIRTEEEAPHHPEFPSDDAVPIPIEFNDRIEQILKRLIESSVD